MATNLIKQVIDKGLSGLQVSPQEIGIILGKAKGEGKVKKKLSYGLIAAIVIICLALTAVAATLIWEQYVPQMKQEEKKKGYYENWSAHDKETLVKNLTEMGYVDETGRAEKLFDPKTPEVEKHQLADRIMLTLTGQEDVAEISADIITYALFGPEDTWTSAQRVWWAGVINSVRDTSGDVDTLVRPLGHEVPEKEAIEIAREAIIKTHQMAPDALDKARPVADMYVTKQRPDYRRWMVQFKFYKEGADNYVERVYLTVVDEHAEVIADADVGVPSLDDMAAGHRALEEKTQAAKPPIIQAYWKYIQAESFSAFGSWSLETKAAFSQEIRPMMAEAEKNGELKEYLMEGGVLVNGQNLLAKTRYAYGLPGGEDIPQAEALERAKTALQEACGVSRQTLEGAASIAVYFDVTDPAKPLWKFFFGPNWAEETDIRKAYRVQIDARSGTAVLKEAINWKEMAGDDPRWY